MASHPNILAVRTHELYKKTRYYRYYILKNGASCGSDSKASAYNVGDLGLIPGSGRSPGEGNGNPL